MEKLEKKHPPYRVINRGGTGEVIEKKSRFIGVCTSAQTEVQALDFIEMIRKKHYDARHHCYAYIIGSNDEIVRYSDDGEPSGTAGKPILEVVQGQALTNTVVVVTRYFGGTLLGTGGLVRAYTQATKECITGSEIVTMHYTVVMRLEIDYVDLGKIQYMTAQKKITVLAQEYADQVFMTVRVPWEEKDNFSKALIETTSARIRMKEETCGYAKDVM